jgi:hypothetical protein
MTKDLNKATDIINFDLDKNSKQRPSVIYLELGKSDQDDKKEHIIRKTSIPAYFYKDANSYFNDPDEIAKRKIIIQSINEQYLKTEEENFKLVKLRTNKNKRKKVKFSSKIQYIDGENESFKKILKNKIDQMTSIFNLKKIKYLTNADKLSNYYFNDDSNENLAIMYQNQPKLHKKHNNDQIQLDNINREPLKLKSILKLKN